MLTVEVACSWHVLVASLWRLATSARFLGAELRRGIAKAKLGNPGAQQDHGNPTDKDGQDCGCSELGLQS